MQRQPLWRRDFLSICLSSLFLFITYYALVATLPVYVMEVLNGGDREAGLTLTAFIIAAVFFRPLAGKWVDEIGKKKIFLIFSAVFMASTFLYFGIASLVFLLALRFIHGVSFGFATTAMAAIATDLVPEERKGEGIGYYAMFMNIAMVIGPFMGLTIMHQLSFTVLMVILSLLSVFSFLCGGLTRVFERKMDAKLNTSAKFHWKNFIEPAAVPISLTALLLSFAYSGLLSFIPVYAKEQGMVEASSYFFVIYAIMIVISRPFTGRLFDRMGENVVVYPSIILYAIGLILLSQAHSPVMFLVASGVIGLGYGSVFPSFQAIAIKSAPNERRGLATGTYFLLLDTGMGIGSFVLGMIASAMNYSFMYVVSALMVVFGGITYYTLHHRRAVIRKKRESLQVLNQQG